MDRRLLSQYPDGMAKTTRGTNKWFVKGNYSNDFINVFNTTTSRVVTPVHIRESDYLGTVGPVIDSTKVSVISRYNTFLSDGVNSTFNIEFTPLTKHSLHVYIDGVYQSKDTYNYYEHLVTLAQPVSVGSRVDVVYLTHPQLQTKTFTLSGDGVSTSFSLPFYFPNESFLLVYENGVALNHNTYSVSANTITFNLPLVSGLDNVDIVMFDAPAPNAPLIYVFSGDGVATSFNIGVSDLIYLNTQVFINGVYQEKIKYSLENGIITFP